MTRATGKGHLSEGSVGIATIAAIPLVLEQLGYDPTAVMRECGFDISLFDGYCQVRGKSVRLQA